MSFGIQINDRATPALQQMRGSIQDLMRNGIIDLANEAARLIRADIIKKGSKSKGRTTGNLARSYTPKILSSGRRFTMGVLSDLVYARIQDRGGNIKAKRKFLAIPIGQQASGSDTRWPRDFPAGELFLMMRKGGKSPILASSQGGSIKPRFVLKPSVTLRAQNHIRDAAKELDKIAPRILGEELTARLTRVFKGG